MSYSRYSSHRRPRTPFSGTTEAFFNLMGHDFVAEVDYTVTTLGAAATWDDPGWDADYEIDSITLREDRIDDLGPAFEATGKLFSQLEHSTHLYDCVVDSIERNL